MLVEQNPECDTNRFDQITGGQAPEVNRCDAISVTGDPLQSKDAPSRKAMQALANLVVVLLAMPLFGREEDACASASGCLGCGGCLSLPLLIPLLVIVLPILLITSIIIAVWIYRDAHRRQDPKEMVWSIVGLFFNILGLLYYTNVARKRTLPPDPPQAPVE